MDAKTPLEIEQAGEEEQPRPKASCGNWMIILTFLIASIASLVAHLTDALPARPHVYIESIPTFVVPQGVYWLILAVIGGWEFLFCLAQFSPRCRQERLVKVMTSYVVYVNLLHTAWTVCMALKMPAVALIIVVIYLVALLFLVLRVDSLEPPRFAQLYLIRFPFSVHLGWVLVLAVINLNMVTHAGGILFEVASNPAKIAVCITSLTTLVALTAMFAVAVARPDPLVCGTVGGSFFLIFLKLEDVVAGREGALRPEFSDAVIQGFMWTCLSIVFMAACCTTLALPLRLYQKCCQKSE